MKIISVLTFTVLFLLTTGFQPSDKKEKKAKQELEMAQLIQKGRFMFIPSSASSSIGNVNQINSGYYMAFDSINIISNLPYYGKSFQSYYRLTNGIRFNVATENVKKTWSDRKREYSIKAKLKNNIETYSISLNVELNGFANLKITFSNDELITYYGTIEKIPEN